jgi:hypothetical protein
LGRASHGSDRRGGRFVWGHALIKSSQPT